MHLKRVIEALLAVLPRAGAPRRCVLCGHRIGRFLPFPDAARLAASAQALGLVGSDLDNFECPRCGAHDRERHLYLYFDRSGLLERMRGSRILHFAPEKRLSRRIAAIRPAHYVPCDLLPSRPGISRVDMHDIPHPDESFDIVIANHVLEHVARDRQALGELRRVLRPSGLAVLQTPYSPALAVTHDDAGIVSPAGRLAAYGQEDHVRRYGADFVSRVVAAGFESRVVGHGSLLPDIDPLVHGVNPDEPFFCFERR